MCACESGVRRLTHCSITHTPVVDVDAPIVKLAAGLVGHVMRAVMSDSLRSPRACVALSLLVRNRQCARESVPFAGQLIEMVRVVSDDPSMMRASLVSAVRHLLASRACRAQILAHDGLQIFVWVVNDAGSSMAAKSAAVLSLRRCCKSITAREAVASVDGVQGYVWCLLGMCVCTRWWCCCHACMCRVALFVHTPLSPLTHPHMQRLLVFFFTLGHVQAIQKSLAGLLQTLATNPDIKVQMAAGGAVPQFVALLAMKNLHMLKYVICIIRNLACNNDDNRAAIARSGGIQKLLELMPLVNVKLQQKIAGALQNLATNRENRSEISKYGGVTVLVALIRTNDHKLQKYGLGGVKRLVYNSRESTVSFIQHGGLAPLVALLDSEDLSVLKNAVHALNRIRHYIGREPIERIGGLAAMGRLLTNQHEKVLRLKENECVWLS